jgi:hypothetical protein
MDRSRVIEVTSAVSMVWGLGSRSNLDLVLHVARRYMACIPQAKRHAGWRNRGPMRVRGALTDHDCVGEHVFNAIEPHDLVTRCGWVGFRQQIRVDLLVGGDRVALDDEVSGRSDGFCRYRAEADVDGIGEEVRHALGEDDVT